MGSSRARTSPATCPTEGGRLARPLRALGPPGVPRPQTLDRTSFDRRFLQPTVPRAPTRNGASLVPIPRSDGATMWMKPDQYDDDWEIAEYVWRHARGDDG